ncbi:hypothetical protein NM208_g11157 [Fusarium decemcellulare]|uniref:Uncharacterized protein n=1 Tax=Fusarium decemcellulare TaxID=57161 RepID=A0ACC1RVB1_9HYPO|nr:hypothetical protein NM208_g11157 [Fusarium decemcellulare]
MAASFSAANSLPGINARIQGRLLSATLLFSSSPSTCFTEQSWIVPPGSWVIDWFDAGTWSGSRAVAYLTGQAKFRAQYESITTWSAFGSSRPRVNLKDDRLEIEGTIIDTIRDCPATYAERGSSATTKTSMRPCKKKDVTRQINQCFHLVKQENDHTQHSWFTRMVGGSGLKMHAHNATTMATRTLKLGMRFGETIQGRLGWFTKFAKPGDKVAIAAGCSVPVVLRSLAGKNSYMLVGDSIIPQIMRGEKKSVLEQETVLLLS